MVDSINSANGTLNIQEILSNTVRRKENQESETRGLPIDEATLSSIAQIVNGAKEAGATQEDLENFRIKIMEAVQNGTFDAETLAQQAPTAIKEAAEELGIDLTTALKEMAEDIQTRGAFPPPPPPPSESEDEDDDEETQTTRDAMMKLVHISRSSGASEEELETFRVKIMTAIENGTFDAATLAAQAPEALKEAAEQEGTDLSSALQTMAMRAADQ